MGIDNSNMPVKVGYEMLGFPKIENDSCLFVIGTPGGTASNVINGNFTLVQG